MCSIDGMSPTTDASMLVWYPFAGKVTAQPVKKSTGPLFVLGDMPAGEIWPVGKTRYSAVRFAGQGMASCLTVTYAYWTTIGSAAAFFCGLGVFLPLLLVLLTYITFCLWSFASCSRCPFPLPVVAPLAWLKRRRLCHPHARLRASRQLSRFPNPRSWIGYTGRRDDQLLGGWLTPRMHLGTTVPSEVEVIRLEHLPLCTGNRWTGPQRESTPGAQHETGCCREPPQE